MEKVDVSKDFDFYLNEVAFPLSKQEEVLFSENDALKSVIVSENVRFDSVATVSYGSKEDVEEAETGQSVVTFTSFDESKATVDSRGYVTTIEEGEVDIIATSKYTTKVATHNGRFGRTVSDPTFKQYLDGTLGWKISRDIDVRTFSTEKSLFEVYDHNKSEYFVSKRFYLNDIDWTGISVWNSHAGNRRGATAISPKHVLMATHYIIPIGGTVRFVDTRNGIVERKVVGHDNLGDDITIATLDHDLPSNVKTYSILPKDWRRRLWNLRQLPIICWNRRREALIREANGPEMPGAELSGVRSISHSSPASPLGSGFENRINLTGNLVSGDSGQPAFMLLGHEPILLGCHWTAGGFVNLTSKMDEIQLLLGKYELKVLDLSRYTMYLSENRK